MQGKWIVLGDVEVNIGANASAGTPLPSLLSLVLPRPSLARSPHLALTPTAEEPEEELESSAKKVVDIVDAFRLQETSWDKKGFMGYIKGFMQRIAEKLPEDRRDKFKADAPAAVKSLLARFDELQFFMGETGDLEGTMCYAYYKEGASEPTFLYFKDSLKPVKC